MTVITTKLTTITALPVNVVQAGARSASNAAVRSHAHPNAKIAISGRASGEPCGLATATTSASKITTSVNSAKRSIEEIISAAHDDAATKNLPSCFGLRPVLRDNRHPGGPSIEGGAALRGSSDPCEPAFTLMQMNLCLSGLGSGFRKVAYPAAVVEAVAQIRQTRPDAVTFNEARGPPGPGLT